MHLPDVMTLARRKLGEGARFFSFVRRNADGTRTCCAEVFTSARAGANVPDDAKTKRVTGEAPHVAAYVDQDQKVQRNDGAQRAVDALAEALTALP
jgi:hypothetical protein